MSRQALQDRTLQLSLLGPLETRQRDEAFDNFCSHLCFFPGHFPVFAEYARRLQSRQTVMRRHEQEYNNKTDNEYNKYDEQAAQPLYTQRTPRKLSIEDQISRNQEVLYIAPYEEDPLFLYKDRDKKIILEAGICGLVEVLFYPLYVAVADDSNANGENSSGKNSSGEDSSNRIMMLYAGKPVVTQDPVSVPWMYNRNNRRKMPNCNSNCNYDSNGKVLAIRLLNQKNRVKISREDSKENIKLWQQLYDGNHADYTAVELGWQDFGIFISRDRNHLCLYDANECEQIENAKIDVLAVVCDTQENSRFGGIPFFHGRRGLINGIYGVPLKKTTARPV